MAWSPAAGAIAPAEAAAPTINDQIADADTARREGRLADAARLYAEVYRAMQASDDYRNSDLALEVVVLAASQYHEAFTASNRDFTLCEESQRLLLDFEAAWAARGEPTPEPVVTELRWLEEQLAQRPVPEPAPDPPVEPPPDELDIGPRADETPEPTPAEPPDSLVDPEVTPPPRRPDGLALALTIGGAAVTVTGAVLLGVAVPIRGRAEQYRTDAMTQPEFTERDPPAQQVLTQALDAYVDDERRRGVGMMAAGGALVGLGVAAVVVGSLRLIRRRRGSTRPATASRPRMAAGGLAF